MEHEHTYRASPIVFIPIFAFNLASAIYLKPGVAEVYVMQTLFQMP